MKNRFSIVTTPAPLSTKYTIPTSTVKFYDVYPYFSFRYYDDKHKKYSFQKFTYKDYNKFVKRLKEMSQYKWGEIFGSLKKFYHAHPIKWEDTAEKNGFAHLQKELQDFPVYQFEAFEECRIVGFFNHHNVFKIVWVDRNHDLYSNKHFQ